MPRSAHHPVGPGATRPRDPGLVMTLLGTAETWLDGQRLLLNRRQTEVLALLALHPEGLSLEQLHAMLYGDQAVTFSTLKAEVSHLRAALGGQLGSRPYRLLMPVATDVEHVLALLRRGEVGAAVDAYGGDLLPGTNSPALAELAEYVAVAVREALLADPQPDAVVRYSELAPYDSEVLEVCLAALTGSAASRTPPCRCSRAGSPSRAMSGPAQPALPTRRQPCAPSVSRATRSAFTRTAKGESMTRISLTVDGEKVADDVEPRMLLVQYLREKLGKTGTVIGCDTSNCGACTVHLNGQSVKSCNVLAVQADGAEVTTIEGLADRTVSCTRCRRRSASATASSAASARRG